MHIQALERELGAPLFDRVSSRKFILTEVGRRTLDYANRLLTLAEEAKATVHKRGEPSGPLSVSAPEALVVYRLPEVLRQFQSLFPHAQLILAAHEDFEAQVTAVLDGTLDLAFVAGARLTSERLIAKGLCTEEILIVAAPDYHFITEGEFRWENLAEERILLPDKSCPFRQLFERAASAAQIPLRNVLALTSTEAIKQCAIAGMGLAIIPKMAVTAELKQRRLVCLPWPGLGLPVHVQMIRHRKRSPSPALHALWSLAEQSFEGQLG
jgi:DNA-binding transcriptional LysR family regulator